MKKAKYTIAGLPFPTQEAVFDYAKAIKNAHIGDVAITDPGAIAFLSDLLFHHPHYEEKMANGLQGFCVKPNVLGSGHALCVVPEHGDTDPFKPAKCLAKDNPFTNIFDACRRSIADQTAAYRDNVFATNAEVRCPLYGTVLSPETSHVDHAYPKTFAALVRTWMAENKYAASDIVLESDVDGAKVLADASQRVSWESYHRENANLRVTSIPANLSGYKKLRAPAK